MKDYIIGLIAYTAIIWLHLVTVHKILIWALGGFGMAISVMIMIVITGTAIDEVDR